MRRPILFLTLTTLLLPACDWGLGTDPDDIRLADVSRPPRDHATVVITEDLVDGIGRRTMEAGIEYFFPLRTPPPLPELLFDATIGRGTPLVKVVLEDVTTTGTYQTSSPDITLLFGAPDGAVFEPVTDCRITVTSALDPDGEGRFQAEFDCPMTDGTREMRVLSRLDHSP